MHYRKGQFVEALKAFREEQEPPVVLYSYLAQTDREFANWSFQIAMAAAQLDRRDEATQAFSAGLRVLEQASSGAKRVDLGDDFNGWYLMNAARMEADQIFREKGISVPTL